MDSFYSIIYYKVNVLTDELIAVGVISGGGEGPFIYFSPARLDLIKKTTHPNTSLSLKRHIKYLCEKVDKHRNESSGILLFDPVFSSEQLENLSDKTKGAILYSKPVSINEWLDATFFEKLTRSFLGEKKQKTAKRPVFHLKWKAYYRSKTFEDWGKDIALSTLIDSSSLNIKIDLVNYKEKQLIKGLDFDLSLALLNRKLYEIELLQNALPNYKLLVVHPAPRKKTGKDALESMRKQFQEIEYEIFYKFKKMT